MNVAIDFNAPEIKLLVLLKQEHAKDRHTSETKAIDKLWRFCDQLSEDIEKENTRRKKAKQPLIGSCANGTLFQRYFAFFEKGDFSPLNNSRSKIPDVLVRYATRNLEGKKAWTWKEFQELHVLLDKDKAESVLQSLALITAPFNIESDKIDREVNHFQNLRSKVIVGIKFSKNNFNYPERFRLLVNNNISIERIQACSIATFFIDNTHVKFDTENKKAILFGEVFHPALMYEKHFKEQRRAYYSIRHIQISFDFGGTPNQFRGFSSSGDVLFYSSENFEKDIEYCRPYNNSPCLLAMDCHSKGYFMHTLRFLGRSDFEEFYKRGYYIDPDAKVDSLF